MVGNRPGARHATATMEPVKKRKPNGNERRRKAMRRDLMEAVVGVGVSSSPILGCGESSTLPSPLLHEEPREGRRTMWSGLKNALEMFHSFSMARPWSEGPLAAGRSDCVQAAEPNEDPSSATEAALRAENAQLRAMLHAARTESQYMSVQFRKLREKLLAPRVHPQIDPDPQVDPDPPDLDLEPLMFATTRFLGVASAIQLSQIAGGILKTICVKAIPVAAHGLVSQAFEACGLVALKGYGFRGDLRAFVAAGEAFDARGIASRRARSRR